MKHKLLLFLSILTLSFYSCEKDNGPEVLTWDNSAEAYLKDSTLYITKLLSLWQDKIVPADINDILDSNKVRTITAPYETAEDLLGYLTSLTPKDPASKMPIDRFSFIDRQSVVSDEIENAIATSYGIYTIFLQTQESAADNNNAYLYVRMVDRGSNANEAGIGRGDRIISINGNTKFDYNTQKAQDFKGLIDALNSKSMKIKVRTPEGVEFETTIYNKAYTLFPIITASTTNVGGEGVGYFALSSFLSIETVDGQKTNLYHGLNTIFENFENINAKYLIVDLRYNGGGATNTAEFLANKIVPSSAENKIMYTYKTNPFVQQEFSELLMPVSFHKEGNLELKKVYFLVTESTASASELLINVLKPYMDVQIIGPENTYGKPVGFWGILIGKPEAAADIYVTSFQLFNANNNGDYFSGFTPNKIANEGYLNDFGDPNEGLLRTAVYHIANGSYPTLTRSMQGSMLRALPQNKQNFEFKSRASDLGMFKFGNKKLKN